MSDISVQIAAGGRAVFRRDAWRVSVPLLVSFWVVFAALHTILEGFGWWFAMAGITLVVLGSTSLTRTVSAREWLPPVVGVLSLVGTLTLFFSAGSAFLFIIPSFDTIGTFGELGQAGAQSVASQSVPAEATSGIIFLVCVGAGSLAILNDLIAVAWRRPALAALPLAVFLAIPMFVGIGYSDAFVFVLAAISWLVLLRAGQPYPQTGRSIGLGAAAIVAALLVPVGLPQVGLPTVSNDRFEGFLAGVNPALNLGDDLRRELPRTVLTYSSELGEPTYLRLVSLQNFTTGTWEPDPPTIDRANLPEAVGPPRGLAPNVARSEEKTWVEAKNLGSPWLPVPYPATQVNGLTGEWFWDAADLTFTSPSRNARGEEYQVQSLKVQPTPEQLASAGSIVPGDFDKYLQLPAEMPDVIASTAREVTAAANSDYGKAVRLQEYFRGGNFAYSETAPVEQGYDGSGMEVLEEFLGVKSGYCIHFASAMAVMARTVGIPSRVAVGTLPGKALDARVDGRIEHRVTTQDVHSWPELFFEGVGWIRFEPTPGRGLVPTYADRATPGVPTTLDPEDSPTATPTPTTAPSNSAGPRVAEDILSEGATSTAGSGWLWPMIVVLGIAVLLLIPAVVRGVQRGIRMRRLSRSSPLVSTGWREIVQSAEDYDFELSGTATPREVARALVTAARLDDGSRSALDAVVMKVERESFAKNSLPRDGAELVHDIRHVLGSLRSDLGWRARWAAVVAPRSTWRRIVGASRGD